MSRILRPEEPMLNITAWVTPRLPKKSRISPSRIVTAVYILVAICTTLIPQLETVNHIMLAGLFGYCIGKVYYFLRS